MNRTIITALATGLVAGFVLGFLAHGKFTETTSTEAVSRSVSPSTVGSPFPGTPPATSPDPALVSQILSAEASVRVDSKDVQAWTTLGNAYFDLHQAQKSVDAYAKALALDPSSPKAPDLLTDQGVMYKELKEFDKAIANFRKAFKLDPKHAQSLFNLGVVLSQDKNDVPGALKAWNQVIEIAPTSTLADQARDLISKLPRR